MDNGARRIDHVVLAVDDLEGAADRFARLGFQVGARNRHPWGTENRLIQFDRSFIELITVAPDAAIEEHAPGRFSFGAFVRDYLREREGLAMLVLDSANASADAARFARDGIGSSKPFFFERTARRPDASETRVAFTLAFAADPRSPDAGFFVCQQHYPENFWNAAFQHHPNGATAIGAVGMVAADPESHAAFLEAFADARATRQVDGRLCLGLHAGRLTVDPDRAAQGLQLVSLSVVVGRGGHQRSHREYRALGAAAGSSIRLAGVDIFFNSHDED